MPRGKRSHHWRFLGSSTTKDVGKILLEYLDPVGKPLECYRLFLKNSVSFNTAQKCISFMTQDLLEKFYCLKEPLVHAKFFSLFQETCISKLENVLNKRIVIVMPETYDSFRKVHDKRVYQRLERPGSDPREVLYFVLENTEESWNLYEMQTEMDRKLYVQLQTELQFFDPKTLKVAREGDCLLRVVASVLGRVLPDHHVHSPACSSLREMIFSKDKYKIAKELGAEFFLASHIRSSPKVRRILKHSPKNNVFGVHAIFDLRDDPDSVGLADMAVVCVTENLRFYQLGEAFASSVKFVRKLQRHPKKETFPAPGNRLQQHQQQQQRQRRLLHGARSLEQLEAEGVVHQVEVCPCGGCRDQNNFQFNMSENGPQKKFSCDLSAFDLLRLLGKFDETVEADLLRACRLSAGSFDVESMATAVPDDGFEDANLDPGTASKIKLPRQVTCVQEPVRIGFTDEARMEAGLPTLVFRHDPSTPNAMIGEFVEALFSHRDESVVMRYEILHPLFQWLDLYKRKHYEFFSARGWLPPAYLQRWQNSHWEPADPSPELDLEEEAWMRDLAAQHLEEEEDEESSASSSRAASPTLEPDWDEPSSSSSSSYRLGSASAGSVGTEAAEKLKKERDARRIADVEKSWQHGIFGILESRLRQLCNSYYIFGFNAERFDLVILSSLLITYCRETFRRDISLHRQGSTIRWLKVCGIHLGEIKRLVSPGFSLSALGAACQLEEVKCLFPFSKFDSLEFLQLPKLPSLASDWLNTLNPSSSPSQAQVDECLAFYEEHAFPNISSYLEWYLDKDCIILQKSVIALGQVYYQILGLHFLESRRLTCSSLASCGAQTWMARRVLPSQTFPNHRRLYSLLKKSLRGGLTTVARTTSGKHADLSGYVKLLSQQMEEGGEDGGPDLDLCERVKASGLDLSSYASHCNAHLMPAGTTHPAEACLYLDINA